MVSGGALSNAGPGCSRIGFASWCNRCLHPSLVSFAIVLAYVVAALHG